MPGIGLSIERKKVLCCRFVYKITNRAMAFESPTYPVILTFEYMTSVSKRFPSLKLSNFFLLNFCWLWVELGKSCLIWRENWFHSHRSVSAMLTPSKWKPTFSWAYEPLTRALPCDWVYSSPDVSVGFCNCLSMAAPQCPCRASSLSGWGRK